MKMSETLQINVSQVVVLVPIWTLRVLDFVEKDWKELQYQTIQYVELFTLTCWMVCVYSSHTVSGTSRVSMRGLNSKIS